MTDLAYQTRPAQGYPPEASVFADALEAVMADGTHDLPGIAAALNAEGTTIAGRPGWTAETLAAYLAELANA